MTQVPATLLHPMGSMGEEIDSVHLAAPQNGEDFRAGPALSTAARPYKTLAEWNRLFPSLTRTEQAYRPWDKAQGDAS